MPSIAALVTASAVRQIERRAATTPDAAPVVVDDHAPAPRWHMPEPAAPVERCSVCPDDRNRGPDGLWPVAVAHVELPAWCWDGWVCSAHLAEAKQAAHEAGERCHVRPVRIAPLIPAGVRAFYAPAPRRRARRVITPDRGGERHH